ncbi:MAG: hypothetical protein H6725_20540 [Sandaracinaceae bacterium]|nr:hypothetical protein [Sandaracinaceae bacterium]
MRDTQHADGRGADKPQVVAGAGRASLRGRGRRELADPARRLPLAFVQRWTYVSSMSSPVRKILDEIYKLPKEQRALVRAELDSLDEDVVQEDVDLEWDDEIARRVRGIQDGTAVLHSDEHVEQRIRAVLER